jgi:hypothetical protein
VGHHPLHQLLHLLEVAQHGPFERAATSPFLRRPLHPVERPAQTTTVDRFPQGRRAPEVTVGEKLDIAYA